MKRNPRIYGSRDLAGKGETPPPVSLPPLPVNSMAGFRLFPSLSELQSQVVGAREKRGLLLAAVFQGYLTPGSAVGVSFFNAKSRRSQSER